MIIIDYIDLQIIKQFLLLIIENNIIPIITDIGRYAKIVSFFGFKLSYIQQQYQSIFGTDKILIYLD